MEGNITSELLRNLSIISEDQTLLAKAVKYLRKLVSEKESNEEMGYACAEEYVEKLQRSERQISEGRYVKINDSKQLVEWLESL